MINNLKSHKESFPIECSQIEFLDNILSEINNQLNTYLVLFENEINNYILRYNSLLSLSQKYYNEIKLFSNEPSNIFYLTQIIINMFINASKNCKEKFNNLFIDVKSSIPEYNNKINSIKENIIINSDKIMKEIEKIMKEINSIEKEYKKYKNNLDDAQMNKKKIDNNPRYLYNITVKNKADKDVLNNINVIEKIFPKFEKLSKDLKEKKEKFNLLMKDNFEIVVMNSFKYLAILHQIFYLYSKNKYDLLECQLDLFKKLNFDINNLTVNINDYAEKKYGELKDKNFELIDNINLNDNIYDNNPNQQILISNSFLNYVDCFIECLRSRKKIVKFFNYLIKNYILYEEDKLKNLKKNYIKIIDYINSLEYIGNGTKKSWKNIFNNNNMTDEIIVQKNLLNYELNNFIVNCRNDQMNFKNKWKKYENKIKKYKENIEKFTINNKNDIKKSLSNDKMKILLEKNLKLLKKTFDFIKINIPIIREKDINRCNKLIEIFANSSKNNINSVEKFIEISCNEIENSTNLDIFEEISEIFKKYFYKFKITNYENFMEKIKMKIIINTDFQKEKIGQNVYEELNNNNFENNSINFLNGIENNLDISSEEEKGIEKEINLMSGLSSMSVKKKNNNNNNELLKSSKNFMLENNKNQKTNEINSNVKSFIKSNGNITNTITTTNDNNNNNKNYFSDESFSDDSNENIDFIKEIKYENILETKNKYKEIENIKKFYSDKNINNNENNFNEENKNNEIDDKNIIDSFKCTFKDKLIILQGILTLTNENLIFESKISSKNIFGKEGTKLIIPLIEIKNIKKKSNLKIIENSIEIETEKLKLLFSSFKNRDNCFNVIYKQLEEIKTKNNENNNNENEENNNNNENKSTKKFTKLKLKKSKEISKLLEKIDFYNRLEKIHKERLEQFNQKYYNFKEGTFLSIKEFKEVFVEDFPFTGTPLSIVFNSLFNDHSKIEELNQNKPYYESIYLNRGDYDLNYQEINDDNNKIENVPEYFKNNEYVLNLFSNFNESELEKFLSEIPNWFDYYKFRLIYTHKMKKQFIGPDKINEDGNYITYFVSPKLLVMDDIEYGSGFPFCNSFFPITQYRFTCDLKFNEKKGKFEFITKLNIGFLVHFIKSCLFKGKIESAGYSEAKDAINYFFLENVKLVLNSQTLIFEEMFNKVTEENIVRKIIQKENFADGVDDVDVDDESEKNFDDDNKNDNEIENKVVNENNNINNENDNKNDKLKNNNNNKSFIDEYKMYVQIFIGIFLGVILYVLFKNYSIETKKINLNFILNLVMIIVIIILLLKQNKNSNNSNNNNSNNK